MTEFDEIRIVERPWGRLAYRSEGHGPVLLLLHSLGLDSRMWSPIHTEFAASHRIIAPDFRGHGSSRWDGVPFTVHDLAADLGALINVLGAEQVDVVGLSMGGSVAAVFAELFDDRVRGLGLCDTTAWYGEEATSRWAERARMAEEVARPDQLPFQLGRWFSEHFREQSGDVVDFVAEIFVATDSAAHAQACRALGSLDARPALGAIRAATVVATGAEDYATPPAMGRDLAAGISGAVFVELPGVRHLSLLESAALRARLMAHLAGSPTSVGTSATTRVG